MFGNVKNSFKGFSMSQPVLKALNGKYMFGNNFHSLKTNFDYSERNLCMALHIIMRMVQLFIMDVSLDIIIQIK